MGRPAPACPGGLIAALVAACEAGFDENAKKRDGRKAAEFLDKEFLLTAEMAENGQSGIS